MRIATFPDGTEQSFEDDVTDDAIDYWTLNNKPEVFYKEDGSLRDHVTPEYINRLRNAQAAYAAERDSQQLGEDGQPTEKAKQSPRYMPIPFTNTQLPGAVKDAVTSASTGFKQVWNSTNRLAADTLMALDPDTDYRANYDIQNQEIAEAQESIAPENMWDPNKTAWQNLRNGRAVLNVATGAVGSSLGYWGSLGVGAVDPYYDINDALQEAGFTSYGADEIIAGGAAAGIAALDAFGLGFFGRSLKNAAASRALGASGRASAKILKNALNGIDILDDTIEKGVLNHLRNPILPKTIAKEVMENKWWQLGKKLEALENKWYGGLAVENTTELIQEQIQKAAKGEGLLTTNEAVATMIGASGMGGAVDATKIALGGSSEAPKDPLEIEAKAAEDIDKIRFVRGQKLETLGIRLKWDRNPNLPQSEKLEDLKFVSGVLPEELPYVAQHLGNGTDITATEKLLRQNGIEIAYEGATYKPLFNEDTRNSLKSSFGQGIVGDFLVDYTEHLFRQHAFNNGIDPNQLATMVEFEGPMQRLDAWRRSGTINTLDEQVGTRFELDKGVLTPSASGRYSGNVRVGSLVDLLSSIKDPKQATKVAAATTPEALQRAVSKASVSGFNFDAVQLGNDTVLLNNSAVKKLDPESFSKPVMQQKFNVFKNDLVKFLTRMGDTATMEAFDLNNITFDQLVEKYPSIMAFRSFSDLTNAAGGVVLDNNGEPLTDEKGGLVAARGAYKKPSGPGSKHLIRAFATGNISTFFHEFAHFVRNSATGKMKEDIDKAYGVVNGVWNEAQEEAFASDFQAYMTVDKAAPDTIEPIMHWATGMARSFSGKLRETFSGQSDLEVHRVLSIITRGYDEFVREALTSGQALNASIPKANYFGSGQPGVYKKPPTPTTPVGSGASAATQFLATHKPAQPARVAKVAPSLASSPAIAAIVSSTASSGTANVSLSTRAVDNYIQAIQPLLPFAVTPQPNMSIEDINAMVFKELENHDQTFATAFVQFLAKREKKMMQIATTIDGKDKLGYLKAVWRLWSSKLKGVDNTPFKEVFESFIGTDIGTLAAWVKDGMREDQLDIFPIEAIALEEIDDGTLFEAFQHQNQRMYFDKKTGTFRASKTYQSGTYNFHTDSPWAEESEPVGKGMNAKIDAKSWDLFKDPSAIRDILDKYKQEGRLTSSEYTALVKMELMHEQIETKAFALIDAGMTKAAKAVLDAHIEDIKEASKAHRYMIGADFQAARVAAQMRKIAVAMAELAARQKQSRKATDNTPIFSKGMQQILWEALDSGDIAALEGVERALALTKGKKAGHLFWYVWFNNSVLSSMAGRINDIVGTLSWIAFAGPQMGLQAVVTAPINAYLRATGRIPYKPYYLRSILPFYGGLLSAAPKAMKAFHTGLFKSSAEVIKEIRSGTLPGATLFDQESGLYEQAAMEEAIKMGRMGASGYYMYRALTPFTKLIAGIDLGMKAIAEAGFQNQIAKDTLIATQNGTLASYQIASVLNEMPFFKRTKDAGHRKMMSEEMGKYLKSIGKDIHELDQVDLKGMSPAMLQNATEIANANYIARMTERSAFQEHLGKLDFLSGFRRVGILKPLFYFIKTRSNLFLQGFYRIPGAGALMAKGMKYTFPEILSMQLQSAALFAATAWMMSMGMLVGGEPEDEEDKARWEAEAIKPYSMKLGDRWWTYSWLAPLSYPIMWMADAIRIYNQMEANNLDPLKTPKGADDLIGEVMEMTMQWAAKSSVFSLSYGLGTNATSSLAMLARGMVIPFSGALRDLSKMAEYMTKGEKPSLQYSGIGEIYGPLMSGEQVEWMIANGHAKVKTDQFGREIKTDLWGDWFPWKSGYTAEKGMVDVEMERIGLVAQMPSRRVVDLGREEVWVPDSVWNQYLVDYGQAQYKAVEKLMGMKHYSAASNAKRRILVEQAMARAARVELNKLKAKARKYKWEWRRQRELIVAPPE